jgi:hypothetical protein
MVTLLGAIALGTDVAILYLNWVQLQKAADAGALAGAGVLQHEYVTLTSANPSLATSTADGYACADGINDSANRGDATLCPNPANNPQYVDTVLYTNYDPAKNQVSIGLQRQVPYFFASLFGMSTGLVKAAAVAVAPKGAGGANGAFPAVFGCVAPCKSISNLPGSPTSFGNKFTMTATGNWGWLNLGQGNGGSQLTTAIVNGVSNTVSIGDSLGTVTGQKTGPINQAWNSLLAEHNTDTNNLDPNTICNGSNPTNIPEGDPLLVTVPVGDISGISGGSGTMTVLGFAEVYLTGIAANKGTISGCFVQEVNTKTIGGNSTAPNLGAVPPVALLQ